MSLFSALCRLFQLLPYGVVSFSIGTVLIRRLMLAWPGSRRAALCNLRRITNTNDYSHSKFIA